MMMVMTSPGEAYNPGDADYYHPGDTDEAFCTFECFLHILVLVVVRSRSSREWHPRFDPAHGKFSQQIVSDLLPMFTNGAAAMRRP